MSFYRISIERHAGFNQLGVWHILVNGECVAMTLHDSLADADALAWQIEKGLIA